jgi:ethanolamine utilization cobalamin adenosyltransferase
MERIQDMVMDIQVMLGIQVMVVMAATVVMVATVDMVDTDILMVNSIVIVNLQPENLLTNSHLLPETTLNMIIKMLTSSRTQMLIEEPLFQMFNNHHLLLQLTLRECQ